MTASFRILPPAHATARGRALRNTVPACLVLLLLLLPGVAAAAHFCSSYGSRPGDATQRFSMPTSLVVRPGTAPGTVLWTQTFSMPRYIFAKCGLFGRSTLTSDVHGVNPFRNGYWGTDVPGVGYRLQRSGADIVNASASIQIGPHFVEILPETWTISLVRTAETLGSGTIRSPWLRVYFNTNNAGNIVMVWDVTGNGTTTVRSPSCSVRGTTVNLGRVLSSELPQVGSTTATSATSNLALSCSSAPVVYMRMTSGTVAGSNSVLPTTGGAKGVGVQLMYGNAPMLRNQDYLVSGAAPAALNVPVAARYYRIADITPGVANASAVVQFTYH